MRTIQRLLAACVLAVAASAGAAVKLTPQLKVMAEERYDDDLLLRVGPSDSGQLMTKISPRGGLTLSDPTLTSELWYAMDFMARHGSGTLTLDHRGGLGAKKRLSDRASLHLDMRIWRVSDPTSLPRLGMARSLSPILYGQGELVGSYLLTRRWTGRLGYRFEGARIYEGHARVGTMHSPYMEAWYAATRRTDVGMQYRFQLFAYEGEVATSHGALARYRYRLSRTMRFTAQGGPVWLRQADGRQHLLPSATLELAREGDGLEVGLVVGHDLVGASGFSSALWADFASGLVTWRPAARWQLHVIASYYRNGRLPAVGFNPFGPDPAASGYALGVGAEWRLNRMVSFQLSLDRYAQLGGVEPGTVDLDRNIASVRAVVTAF